MKNSIFNCSETIGMIYRKEVEMEQNNELKLFEDKKIRTKWNDEEERWYFSVVDIVAALTDNDYQTGRKYWSVLKTRLKKREVSWLQIVVN